MNLNIPRLTPIDNLAALIAAYRELGLSQACLHIRTVAFKAENEWLNFATLARVEPGKRKANTKTIIRDSAALVELCVPIDAKFSARRLSKALSYWRSALYAGKGLTFQTPVHMTRNPSDVRIEGWPNWSTRLNTAEGQVGRAIPEGPFHDRKLSIFGTSIAMLATQFLGDPSYGNNAGNSPNDYFVHIPDYRARITALDTIERKLHLGIANPGRLKLFWSVMATPLAGAVFHTLIEIHGAKPSSVVIPFTPQKLQLWLIVEDGTMIDYYEDNPHYSTWGPSGSLYNRPDRVVTHELLQSLAKGENDGVEFKPYIELGDKLNEKAVEVLESVSAFANAGGGSIYIGVNKNGEPTGVEGNLRKRYSKTVLDDPAREAAYSQDLRQFINEGTAPNLNLEFIWRHLAGRAVLEVQVPQSQSPVHLTISGDLFKRTGATNKKWRAIDAMAYGKPQANPFGF